MAHFSKIEDWLAITFASGLGFLVWWILQSHKLSDNVAHATAYSVIVFVLLAISLRPAWRRIQLWADLLILLVLHSILLLLLVNFLDTHSVRLNWALAMPFVLFEGFLALAVLWRRNMTGKAEKQ